MARSQEGELVALAGGAPTLVLHASAARQGDALWPHGEHRVSQTLNGDLDEPGLVQAQLEISLAEQSEALPGE